MSTLALRTRSAPGPAVVGPLLHGPLLAWAALGAPFALDMPALRGFNFAGGVAVSPEYGALTLGLVLYTAAFIAEIVRSGIQAVPTGQWEAAGALGLYRGTILRQRELGALGLTPAAGLPAKLDQIDPAQAEKAA